MPEPVIVAVPGGRGRGSADDEGDKCVVSSMGEDDDDEAVWFWFCVGRAPDVVAAESRRPPIDVDEPYTLCVWVWVPTRSLPSLCALAGAGRVGTTGVGWELDS